MGEDTEFIRKETEKMNAFKVLWQWKFFYWKVFSTVVITGSALMVAGLATGDGTIITVERAMRWMFWLSVASGVTKAVDALIDHIFGDIKTIMKSILVTMNIGQGPTEPFPSQSTTTTETKKT